MKYNVAYNLKKKIILFSIITCVSLLMLNYGTVHSFKEPSKTIPTLHEFDNASFNGVQTIVFSAKLAKEVEIESLLKR